MKLNSQKGGMSLYQQVDALYHRWIAHLRLSKAQDHSPSFDNRHSQMMNEDLLELQKEAWLLKQQLPDEPRLNIILAHDVKTQRLIARKG